MDDNCHRNVWWHRVEGCKELDILALSPSPDQPKTRDSIRGLKDWQGQSCSRENLARYTALFLSTRNCGEMCKLAPGSSECFAKVWNRGWETIPGAARITAVCQK